MKRTPFRRKNKFGNTPVVIDGIKFQSTLEGVHYNMLKMQLLAGEISDLDLQHEMPLKVANKLICTYIADYYYYDKACQKWVISDAKGIETDVFKIKWKLAKALYPEFIFELRKKWKVTR